MCAEKFVDFFQNALVLDIAVTPLERAGQRIRVLAYIRDCFWIIYSSFDNLKGISVNVRYRSHTDR